MLILIDYNMGNLGSVTNALTHLNTPFQIATNPKNINHCDGIILPGVGNFGDGMKNLNTAGWTPWLQKYTAANRPFLGICLGMQMLFESSEEAPNTPGLKIFPGKVTRFPPHAAKVPQIGWNNVQTVKNIPILQKLDNEFFYFVHSYYVTPENPAITAGITDYILPFTSAIGLGNVAATQFHPEKSQQAGLTLLRNFAELAHDQRR